MNPQKLRSAAAGAAVGLTLALGFPDSEGLWSLRLIAAWPGEIGRALGNLVTAGHLAPLALGQSPDVQLLSTSAQGRALAATLGLAAQLACAIGLLQIADRPRWSRGLFAALAGAALIAALWPPLALVTVAEVGAAVALGLLAVTRPEGSRTVALALLAGIAGTAPLAELRPVLLSTGRAQGAVAALEPATGIAASAFALLAFALFAAATFALARKPPIATTPAPEAATVPPP